MAYETQQQPEPPAHAHGGGGGPSGPRAGFWQRLGAILLDGILIAVVQLIVVGILGAISEDLAIVGYFIMIVAGIAYYVYFEGGPTGQTIGKKALGIRVYDLKQGGPIGYGRAFIRYLGRIVSGAVLLLGYLWSIWDSEKQTWHDKFAGSVVVPASDYPVS
jgi:uncharacterized RDD family membrane protein YckC